MNKSCGMGLHGEYLEKYRRIYIYLLTRSVNHFVLEEVSQDILDLFLESQARGEDVQSVIGNDYKLFSREIINESMLKVKPAFLNYSYLKSILFIQALVVSAYGLIALFNYLWDQRPTAVLEVSITSAIIIGGTLLGAFIIIRIIVKTGYSIYKMGYMFMALLLPLGIITLLSLMSLDMSLVLFRINALFAIALTWAGVLIAREMENRTLKA